MNSEIKIPTLLALAVLLTGVIVGVYSVNQNTSLTTSASSSVIPRNIQVSNISGTSAAISWETNTQVRSYLNIGTTPILGSVLLDDRDAYSPELHTLHFVTLKDLLPNTTYYYKISSSSLDYPSTALSFKTPATVSYSSNEPLIGTIVDSNLQPISEAFIILEVPNTQVMMTISKNGGVFLMPLADIKNSTFDKPFIFNTTTKAKLTIYTPLESSVINLNLPYKSSQLPQFILGKNYNLTLNSSNSNNVLGASILYLDKNNLDFNHDGKVDLLDLSILLTNLKKQKPDSWADLNGDGVVDEKDVDMFLSSMNSISNP